MTAASGSFAAGVGHGYGSGAGNPNGENGNHFGNGFDAAGNDGNHSSANRRSGNSGPLVLPMSGQGNGATPAVVVPDLVDLAAAGAPAGSCQGGDLCEVEGSAISAVPLPEGGVLLATGLIWLFGIRRFRRRG